MLKKLRELIGASDESDEKPTLEEVGCVDAHRAIHGEMDDDEGRTYKHSLECDHEETEIVHHDDDVAPAEYSVQCAICARLLKWTDNPEEGQ